jgi:leader peptidase (prepilin peptidase)/N-methyltransferase
MLFTLLGAVIGSFLNVCIDRLPAGKSIIFPASHCDSCQHRLSIKELVPVFSYLFLRGRCLHCDVKVSRRVLWVELGSALVFGFLFWNYGPGLELVLMTFYYCLFMVLLVIDLEHRLILNKIVYPAAIVILIIDVFWEPPGFVNGLLGGLAGFAFFLVLALIFRGGIGFGDVKMAGLIGLVTGFPSVMVALLLGIILGGLIAVILLVLKIKKRKDYLPFGPFLGIATMITLIWGSPLINWYLALFQT